MSVWKWTEAGFGVSRKPARVVFREEIKHPEEIKRHLAEAIKHFSENVSHIPEKDQESRLPSETLRMQRFYLYWEKARAPENGILC